MFCIICGEYVNQFEFGCLDGAGEIELTFGYGSTFDGESYKTFIHDRCFESHKQKFIQTGDFILEQKIKRIKKFKRILRYNKSKRLKG